MDYKVMNYRELTELCIEQIKNMSVSWTRMTDCSTAKDHLIKSQIAA